MKVWALKGSTVVLLFALCQLKAPETVARGDSWECKLGAEVFSSMHTYSFIYVFKCIYIYSKSANECKQKSLRCILKSWSINLTWCDLPFLCIVSSLPCADICGEEWHQALAGVPPGSGRPLRCEPEDEAQSPCQDRRQPDGLAAILRHRRAARHLGPRMRMTVHISFNFSSSHWEWMCL